jgi:hypothetical protein
MNTCPYIDPPTIPDGMTIHEYRINRPPARRKIIRRVVGFFVEPA